MAILQFTVKRALSPHCILRSLSNNTTNYNLISLGLIPRVSGNLGLLRSKLDRKIRGLQTITIVVFRR